MDITLVTTNVWFGVIGGGAVGWWVTWPGALASVPLPSRSDRFDSLGKFIGCLVRHNLNLAFFRDFWYWDSEHILCSIVSLSHLMSGIQTLSISFVCHVLIKLWLIKSHRFFYEALDWTVFEQDWISLLIDREVNVPPRLAPGFSNHKNFRLLVRFLHAIDRGPIADSAALHICT